MRSKMSNEFVKRAVGLVKGPAVPKTTIVEKRKITCPWCFVGGGEVEIKFYNDAVQVAKVGEPMKCDACGRYFKVGRRVVLEGIRVS